MKLSRSIHPLTAVLLFRHCSHLSAAEENDCNGNIKKLWKLTLTTDDYPYETSWELNNAGNGTVAFGPPTTEKYGKRKEIIVSKCLNPGQFTFVIKDKGQDGMCCSYGDGGFVMTVDGEMVGELSGEQKFKRKEFEFELVDSTGLDSNNKTTTSSTTISSVELATTSAMSTDDIVNSTDFVLETNSTTPQNWTNFDYTHSKFCGPKVVGGYEIAISQCGPSTICGLSTSQNQYGSSGNDCPKDLMCYADITCGSGPGAETLTLSTSSTADEGDDLGTEVVATNVSNDNGTQADTNIMMVTKRGSFCGTSHSEALSNCLPDAHCSTDDDCTLGACFPGISCTYSTNIATGEIIKSNEAVVSSIMEEYSGAVIRNGIGHYHLLGLCMIGIGGLF